MRIFQSTLPRGSDPIIKCLYFSISISIHAPSRERLKINNLFYVSHNFNPRSLAGATPERCQKQGTALYFNPRSLAGATGVRPALRRMVLISIHAPSRERPAATTICLKSLLFQSTLPRGSDYVLRYNNIFSFNFNPRSLAGATASKQIISLFI